MPKFTFIRCAPLAITVEAPTESEAHRISLERLDDFFTDAVGGPFPSHDESHPESYHVVYHGEAFYPESL